MKKLVFIALTFFTLTSFAQKIKVVEGSLSPLKGQKIITTEFNYDDMLIGGKGLSEEDYIVQKKKDYDKKEAGRGDKFEKSWFADRKERFEPRFNELFTKAASVSVKGESKYTLIFKTTRTEPGFNIGITRRPAMIDAVVTIVETANPTNVIAKLTVYKAPGRDAMGFDYDSGLRIQEAYAKSGKELGQIIAKAK